MEWMVAFPSYQIAEPLPLSNNSQALSAAASRIDISRKRWYTLSGRKNVQQAGVFLWQQCRCLV